MQVETVVNGPIQTNTYFVIVDGECLVVDPAWDGEGLARDFAATYPDVRIVALVCTHGHADHVGGIAGMRKVLGEGVPYLLPSADTDTVSESIAWQRARWGIETPFPGEPTRLIDDGDIISVGSVTFKVIATPGHTPGGVVLFAHDDADKVAFVGDTLFPGGHGRTDLAGGDQGAIMNSLAKLGRTLPADTLCYVGHGPTTTIKQELFCNPFMQ